MTDTQGLIDAILAEDTRIHRVIGKEIADAKQQLSARAGDTSGLPALIDALERVAGNSTRPPRRHGCVHDAPHSPCLNGRGKTNDQCVAATRPAAQDHGRVHTVGTGTHHVG